MSALKTLKTPKKILEKISKDVSRKICILTATRAEWGLLRNLCKEIQNDSALKLQLIVTAAHLSPSFGDTYKEIESEFKIDKKLEILLTNDDKISLCKTMGLEFISLCEALEDLKPDIAVILGDRYEMLAAASVCLMMQVPIAHLCGGELTLGALDDSIRHSISKMAALHFVSTQTYKNRLLQLGEEPWRVFNVGALASDNIKGLKLLSKSALEKALSVKFKSEIYLITYHPETLNLSALKQEITLFLNRLKELKNASLIFTKANADENGHFINETLFEFCQKHENARLFDNLGAQKYLSLMKIATAVVGNSSSGICESPFFKTPCINIGARQEGRLRAFNIIDTSMKELKKAFKTLHSKDFKQGVKTMKNPFKGTKVSFKIKEILKKADLSALLHKKFIDLGSK